MPLLINNDVTARVLNMDAAVPAVENVLKYKLIGVLDY